jgi:uncharacterized protein (DUF302 family)
MRYIVESDKSVEVAVADLQTAVAEHEFGVLNVLNLQQTLKSKGQDLSQSCYILDVCNPVQAVKVLNEDMSMNVALPCRVSVYEQQGATKIAMVKPMTMLTALSDSDVLKAVAEEVEATLIDIIDAAK